MFLVLIDAHSKWIAVFPVHSATTSATLECLRRTFAIHGIPETIVTDNGSRFTSEEFATCMLNNGIQHICVAPYHPASNGMAERAVQTFKQGFTKMREGTIETRVSRFLFRYRNTPQSTNRIPPADMLLGRRPRSHLDLMPQSVPTPPVPGDTIMLLEKMDEFPVNVSQIRTWTNKDPLLSRVRKLVQCGFTEHLKSDKDLKPYLQRKFELSVQDQVLLWGHWLWGHWPSCPSTASEAS